MADNSDFAAKRAAYASDVTYGTNTEMGFDYLRDNMAPSRDAMVQRGHVYGIVDEVDSILVDEARTPLIISGPSDDSTRLYYQFASVVRSLKRDVDYEVDEEKRIVLPTEAGIAKVERQLGVENLYDGVAANFVHQLEKALQAKELYHRDKEYLVADGEVKIVDEFTGRVLEGRRWEDGLHQAVEAKERVKIQEENHTWATVTLQNYFRMYEKLGGMTGTAETEAAEFASTYNLHVIPIPTNQPMIRDDQPDLIYKTEAGKFAAVVDDIVERYETGQPVLVGTASVERSEHLSELLEQKGIPHTVLNAKQHAREAPIVAQAGRLHAVTVATNMAGRGVDIVLGGNPEGLAREEVVASGIDLETDEGQARYAELLAKFTEQCAAEADEVRELGGLYVLGSERHDSRRIDNQLRGRSGRQGDPGESRFFLSLEDELMRLFATGAVSWVMNRALPEDVPLEAKMVTKSIERAQNTVEAKNAEIRKDVLKYDEVMDKQRKVIYERRLQIIDGEDLRELTENLLTETIQKVVADAAPSDFPEEWDLPRLVAEASRYYPTKFTVEELEQATSCQPARREPARRGLRLLRRAGGGLPRRGGDCPRARAPHHVADHRPALAHAPRRDGLPPARHQHAGDGPAGPARGLQEGGLRDVRPADGRHRRRLPAVRDARPARDRGAAPPPTCPRRPTWRPTTRWTRPASWLLVSARGPWRTGQTPCRLRHGARPRLRGAGCPRSWPGAVEMAGRSPAAAGRRRRRAPGGHGAGRHGADGGRWRPRRERAGAAGVRRSGGGRRRRRRRRRQRPAKVGRNAPCWCGSGKKFKLCHGAN